MDISRKSIPIRTANKRFLNMSLLSWLEEHQKGQWGYSRGKMMDRGMKQAERSNLGEFMFNLENSADCSGGGSEQSRGMTILYAKSRAGHLSFHLKRNKYSTQRVTQI